ncbi:MAG TPA: alkaline phosphatase D family protein [Pirellulaceae bacterium]|nr:alkaline phosphatase D family protein [Pirellulaceae bacterium]
MRNHRTVSAVLWTLSVAIGLVFTPVAGADEFSGDWSQTPDRVWAGKTYWANRLQDWHVNGGRLECSQRQARYPMRTVHLLTHQLNDSTGHFAASVRAGLIDDETVGEETAVGLLLGAGGGEMDYRSAALIHHSSGAGAGLFVGVDGLGRAFIRDNESPRSDRGVQVGEATVGIAPQEVLKDVAIRILGTVDTMNPESYILRVSIHDPETNRLFSVASRTIPTTRIIGNIALVSHPGSAPRTGRFWFHDWQASGDKVIAHPEQTAGPILGTQYTLSRNVLKITAQMMPLGARESQRVELHTKQGDVWKPTATTKVVIPGWTATFRVAKWDSTTDTPYRVVYGDSDWSGTIRRDPTDKDSVVVAAFTGNHNNRHGLERGPFNWKTGMWFPHHDLTAQVEKHKPDVLFFSGDQVYEGASPTHPDVANIKLDYMYKWYLFSWAYRDLTKSIPTVTMPDDHDVYQGNLWGEGGRETDKDDKGGYVHPADFVKMAERTQTSHLPDAYHDEPLAQGIRSYYTDMVYGRISFAILEDRKFKSGCNGRVPDSGSSRADHITDPDFDVLKADVPGLQLLGTRQEEFLEAWGQDWQGADMKVALSQTVFANLATHHGGALEYLRADLDSNGWPQSGRNRAVDLLRRCFAFHIGGDQHLATIVQHGIDTWDDGCWSFVVPSIANFYPRAFAPKNKGDYEYPAVEDYTGKFRDGFMNYVTVYAATNPGLPMGHEPADLHDKMPGYGIVRLNKSARTIDMECWPRFADPNDPTDKPYLGWPKTIAQEDNYARKAFGYLPTIEVSDSVNPIVQVIEEATGAVVYTLRIKGSKFTPKVFAAGNFTVKVSDGSQEGTKTLTGLSIDPEADHKTVHVQLLAAWPEFPFDGGTASRTNDAIYLNLAQWPASHQVAFPRLNNPIKKVYLLGQPDQELPLKPEPSNWLVTLPKASPEGALAIVVVETIGQPHWPQVPERITADESGIFVLPAHKAVTHGEMLRYEPQPHKNTVGYWTKPADWAQWHLDVKRAGKYTLHILQGCGTGQGGSEVGIHLRQVTKTEGVPVSLPAPALRFIVQDTGHFQNFVSRELGQVVLKSPGHYTLELRPERLAKNAVMDVRAVRLVVEEDM